MGKIKSVPNYLTPAIVDDFEAKTNSYLEGKRADLLSRYADLPEKVVYQAFHRVAALTESILYLKGLQNTFERCLRQCGLYDAPLITAAIQRLWIGRLECLLEQPETEGLATIATWAGNPMFKGCFRNIVYFCTAASHLEKHGELPARIQKSLNRSLPELTEGQVVSAAEYFEEMTRECVRERIIEVRQYLDEYFPDADTVARRGRRVQFSDEEVAADQSASADESVADEANASVSPPSLTIE